PHHRLSVHYPDCDSPHAAQFPAVYCAPGRLWCLALVDDTCGGGESEEMATATGNRSPPSAHRSSGPAACQWPAMGLAALPGHALLALYISPGSSSHWRRSSPLSGGRVQSRLAERLAVDSGLSIVTLTLSGLSLRRSLLAVRSYAGDAKRTCRAFLPPVGS